MVYIIETRVVGSNPTPSLLYLERRYAKWLYIVDIKGEIEGDYEIIRKYDEQMSEDDAWKVLHDSGWLKRHDEDLKARILAPYIYGGFH